MSESRPPKPWWIGSPEVEKYMPPVAEAILRHLPNGDACTDIYNRAYEAVYRAICDRKEDQDEPIK